MKKTNKLIILLFFVTILLILGLSSKVNATTVTNLPTVSNFEDFETKIDNGSIKSSFSSDVAKGEVNWSRQFDFTIDQPSYVVMRNVAKAANLNSDVDFEVSINTKNLTKKYDSKKADNKSIATTDFRIYLEKGTYTILFTDRYTYGSSAQTLNTYLGILPQNTQPLTVQYVGDSSNGKTVNLKINSLDKVSSLYIENTNFSGAWTNGDKYTLDANNCINFTLDSYDGHGYTFLTITVTDIFGLQTRKEYKILNNYTTTVSGITDKTYTGSQIKQTNYTVNTHYTNCDYLVSYKNNINVGTATITFTGTNNTIGSISKTFKINPASRINASSCKISLASTSYTYNGKVKTPAVRVKNNKGQTIPTSNYTIYYQQGRKNVGKYKVLVKFKGNTYTGSRTLYFTIKPKTTKISSAKRGKGNKVTLRWKKQSAQVNGYQIQYSTNRQFRNAKTVTINKNSTTSKTLSLSKSKKYYLRIRTFKKVGNAKIYSAWK